MAIQRPFPLKKWIDEHRHMLKPPVGNVQVWQDAEFIVMVVGGPNSRKDYHYNEGEEFFYQVEGNVVVKIIEDGVPVDIPIDEGDIFLLPPRTPHSPQRGEGTVGIVIERKRETAELDGFLWYCENCGQKLYEEYEYVTDIVAQLPVIFEKFYSNEINCTCQNCGTKMERPVKR
ncbi:MAG: 3-hydroxyanthranilate 3,4-dioxygenase [Bacteroidota bacterium]|nr:3-hydroxyanthranilate 3,4-dioxygenase [Bacteroidota bacterium]